MHYNVVRGRKGFAAVLTEKYGIKEISMEQKKIDRINELYHKSKSVGLNDAEREEQTALRREYIDSFKLSLTSQLDNMYIVDEKGNKTKVEKKNER
ncbi:MAG: DUF896 domain-containing protein [Candidatus Fimenecus sp.]